MAGDQYEQIQTTPTPDRVVQTAVDGSTTPGTGDAGRLLAAGADGRLSPSLVPPGTSEISAYNNTGAPIAAGRYVYLTYNVAQSRVEMQYATASNAAGIKIAHGFVLASVPSGSTGKVYTSGRNTQVSGFANTDVGADFYLAASNPATGILTKTSPTSPNLSLNIGAGVDWTVSGSLLSVSFQPDSAGSIYTSPQLYFTSSVGESSTSSTSFQTKAQLDFTPPSSGDYFVFWSAEIAVNSSSSSGVGWRLLENNTSFEEARGVEEFDFSRSSDGNEGFVPISGVSLRPGISAAQSMRLQYKSLSGSYTAYIRRARIIAMRVTQL